MTDIQVTYIDHIGTDLSVVNAARVSFDKESGWRSFMDYSLGRTDQYGEPQGYYTKELKDDDAGLIRFLAKHNHKSPFNHTFMSFRVKAPIIVARQLVKHEYMPWNEVSRRYVKTVPEFYHPPVFRKAADNVKQGSSDEAVDMDDFSVAHANPKYLCYLAMQTYQELLRIGVCPEQARMYLPQNMMTEWIWSGTLFAFAKMLNLRLDKHTQYESRLVANLIEPHVARLFPVSWAALKHV